GEDLPPSALPRRPLADEEIEIMCHGRDGTTASLTPCVSEVGFFSVGTGTPSSRPHGYPHAPTGAAPSRRPDGEVSGGRAHPAAYRAHTVTGGARSRLGQPIGFPIVEAYLIDAVRTPFGRHAGGLSHVRTDDLAALPIAELLRRNPEV